MVIYYILAAAAGAVLALAIYIIVSRLISKDRADVFLEKAVAEAETAKQQKMIEAKEHFLQLKSEHDRKVNEKNNQLRDRENNIRAKETQLLSLIHI